MTTLTKEQIVKWAKEAEKLSKAACKEIPGMEYRAAEAIALVTLARADLEAKVAELELDATEMQSDHLTLVDENHSLRQQLAASQEEVARLKSECDKIRKGETL